MAQSVPTVSVVIPAYRAAHLVSRALDSIVAQTSPADEIIVVDDGSPDDMAAAVRPYGDRVTLLRKPNGGASSARNLGIDRARGELVGFLDADDYWEPHKLERQRALFARYPELGTTGSRYFTQQPGSDRVEPPADADPDYDRLLVVPDGRAFRVATKMQTSTLLVRRAVLGGNRFVAGLEPAEDRDLWVRLASAAPVYLTSEPLMTYVEEAGSLCRTNVDRDYGNMLRVVHRHRDLLGSGGVRYWEREVLRKWAARYLGEGHPRAALRPATRRLFKQPLSAEGWWILLKSGLRACRAA